MRPAYRVLLLVLVIGGLSQGRASGQRADTIVADEQTDSSAAPAGAPQAAGSQAAGSEAAGDSTAVDNKDSADQPALPILRVVPDSTLAAWKADADYVYANDPAYWKTPERHESPFAIWLLQVLGSWWTLVVLGAVLLYAIFRIVARNNLQLFYRAARRRPAEKPDEDPRAMEDDLEGKLQHYLQTGDYRQAVRYLYLKSLRMLDDRGLIKYHREATNHEYWQQLGDTAQAAPFRGLTRIYEKVWYGEFALGKPVFDQVHGYFEDFYKTVRG